MDYEWIGPLGGLLPIRAAQAVKNTSSAPMRYYDTVGGGRRAQRLSARPLREWGFEHKSVSFAEADRLVALRDGSYGRGPFALVSTEAQISNVLTPEQSAMTAPMSPRMQSAGPVTIDGNYFPASLAASIPTSWAAFADTVPVAPGIPTTVSLWAMAGPGAAPQMTVLWRSGSTLGESMTVAGSGSGLWQRLVFQGVPPSGVDSVRFGVRAGTTFLAAPQVTWTRNPVDWAAGRGAMSVTVDRVDVSPLFLSGSGEQVANVSWSAMEVS